MTLIEYVDEAVALWRNNGKALILAVAGLAVTSIVLSIFALAIAIV